MKKGFHFLNVQLAFVAIQTLAVLTLVSCAESTETKQQWFLLKGNKALAGGDANQARMYFQEALKVNPCFADALNNLGTIDYDAGHYQQALEQYDKALQCQSAFLPAYFNRANTLYETKEYYRALADLDILQKAKPDSGRVYFLRGLVLTRMRKYSEALEAFTTALQKDSSAMVDAMVNRATVRYYLHQLEEAEQELREAEKLGGQEGNVYNTLAMIQSDKGQFDSALLLIERALQAEPEEPYFLNNRGYIYLRMGKLVEAERDINQSLSGDPYNPWAYRNKGIFYLEKGDGPLAVRLLQQAYGMDEFIDKIHFYRAQAFLLNGQQNEYCSEIKKSVEADEGAVTDKDRKACQLY